MGIYPIGKATFTWEGGLRRLCDALSEREPMAALSNLPNADCDAEYEVRFESLFDPGKGFTFPCDEHGVVDLDALSERARNNYFYARTVVGREFAPATLMRRVAR